MTGPFDADIAMADQLRDLRARIDAPRPDQLTPTVIEGTIRDMWHLGQFQRHPSEDQFRRSTPAEMAAVLDDVLWWAESLRHRMEG